MDWLLFDQIGGRHSVAALDAKVKLAWIKNRRKRAAGDSDPPKMLDGTWLVWQVRTIQKSKASMHFLHATVNVRVSASGPDPGITGPTTWEKYR
jgi:hypothetical protein